MVRKEFEGGMNEDDEPDKTTLEAADCACAAGADPLCLALHGTALLFLLSPGISGSLLGLLGLGELLLVSVPQGIALLVIAFLISPMGLPMAATWLLGKLLGFKYFIQEKAYG